MPVGEKKGSVMSETGGAKGHKRHKKRAIDGIRTRGLHLGKVALYQLSYYRICRTSFGRLVYITKPFGKCQQGI